MIFARKPVDDWRERLKGVPFPWALFEHGTCVLLRDATATSSREELGETAMELLEEWGRVKAGSPSGDFAIREAPGKTKGWIVTCHHEDIVSFVGSKEVGKDADSFAIGVLGRSKRAKDANARNLVHLEVPKGWSAKGS